MFIIYRKHYNNCMRTQSVSAKLSVFYVIIIFKMLLAQPIFFFVPILNKRVAKLGYIWKLSPNWISSYEYPRLAHLLSKAAQYRNTGQEVENNSDFWNYGWEFLLYLYPYKGENQSLNKKWSLFVSQTRNQFYLAI